MRKVQEAEIVGGHCGHWEFPLEISGVFVSQPGNQGSVVGKHLGRKPPDP